MHQDDNVSVSAAKQEDHTVPVGSRSVDVGELVIRVQGPSSCQ